MIQGTTLYLYEHFDLIHAIGESVVLKAKNAID